MTTTIRNRDQVELIHRLMTHVLDDLVLWDWLRQDGAPIMIGDDYSDNAVTQIRMNSLYAFHPAHGPVDHNLPTREVMVAIYGWLSGFLVLHDYEQEGDHGQQWHFPTVAEDRDHEDWYVERGLFFPKGQRGDYAIFTKYVSAATRLGLDDEEFYRRVGAYHKALGLHQKLDAWKSDVERACEQADQEAN